MAWLRAFTALVAREARLAYRQRADVATVLGFFALAVILFPLALGPDLGLLSRVAGSVIWVIALLASLLALGRLFESDYADGSLELLALSPLSLGAVVLAKCAVHWLATGVPLILLAPLLGVTLNLDGAHYGGLLAALALGTPTLSLVGTMGAALTLGARRGGALVALLILPLTVPVLIFGVAAISSADSSALAALAGLFLVALVTAPWAAAAALRQALG